MHALWLKQCCFVLESELAVKINNNRKKRNHPKDILLLYFEALTSWIAHITSSVNSLGTNKAKTSWGLYWWFSSFTKVSQLFVCYLILMWGWRCSVFLTIYKYHEHIKTLLNMVVHSNTFWFLTLSVALSFKPIPIWKNDNE